VQGAESSADKLLVFAVLVKLEEGGFKFDEDFASFFAESLLILVDRI
jgi:hypothetical protein